MKKYVCLVLLTLLSIGYFACTDTDDLEIERKIDFPVSEARAWIDSHYPESLVLKSAGEKVKKYHFTQLWKKATREENDKFVIIEVPLNADQKFAFITEEVMDLMQASGNYDYAQDVTRLLIRKDKESKEISAHFMTISGDPEYMDKTDFKVDANTYLRKDDDFSGRVFYHNLNGDFNIGWKYIEGSLTHRMTGNVGSGLQLKQAQLHEQADCQKIMVYETITNYLEFPSGAIYIQSVVTNVVGSYTICTYSGTGGDVGAPSTTTYESNSDSYQECDCPRCPRCGNCLVLELKGALIPGGDNDPLLPGDDDGTAGTTTTTSQETYDCPDCSCAPEVIIDPTFKGTEAECVKEKLDNQNLIYQLIGGFDLDESVFDLTFKVEDLAGLNGKCRLIDDKTMEIIIGHDRLNASSLELARTILHECFHAYIFGKMYDGELHTGLCPEPNFENDFKAYSEKYGIGPDSQTQHNYMADKYIQYMKQGLRDYFDEESYKTSFLDYVNGNSYWYGTDFMLECLSWGGLQKTEAWSTYSSNTLVKQQYDYTMGLIIELLPREKCDN